MTDPKSISQNREYYTEQYGNARPATREQEVGGSYEASVDISDEFGSGLATDPNIPDEYQEFFANLPAGMGDDSQLMDGVNEQINGSLPAGAAPIQWEASQVASEVQELLDSNKDLLKAADAFDTFKSQFTTLKNKIGDAGVDRDALADQLLEFKDNLSSALDEIKSSNDEKFDSALQSMESLKQQVKQARLPSAKKTELTDKIETWIDTLTKDKRAGKMFGEAGKANQENIQKEVSRAIAEDKLRDSLQAWPARIPGKGRSDLSQPLAQKIRDAIDSDDWSSVERTLNEFKEAYADPAGHPGIVAGGPLAVQQLLGSLYYGIAGKDEEKLDQLLGLIPPDIREQLAQVVDLANPNDNRDVDTEAHKEENALYGTPLVTADRLRRPSIDEAWEVLGEEVNSAPPTTTAG